LPANVSSAAFARPATAAVSRATIISSFAGTTSTFTGEFIGGDRAFAFDGPVPVFVELNSEGSQVFQDGTA